ncbi:MAG: hypothetical protein JSU74_14260 [Candidatus Zixiibacteriota bacterium]|nr:MAG: hypothetical protein JSU74_14260 [candidate division Zixibacteria bacterium]
MNKILVILLLVSIIGNVVGVFAVYKYFAAKRSIGYVKGDLEASNRRVEDLTGVLDRLYSKRLIFLHHSVGRGILYEGGLRDSLLQMGVLVKGATYGDEIGQKTDIKDWLPKFQSDMDRIFSFKAHPDRYYSDGKSNDIVMFKSCFPNSNIVGDGQLPGDQGSSERTMANYRSVFEELKAEMARYPDKLFIYVTAPPLVPESTTPENAANAVAFNRWLIEEYLPDYQRETGHSNLAIFDLFSVLADETGILRGDYRRPDKGDSHPNSRANQVAAAKFMEFFRPVWEVWKARDAYQGV